MGGSEKHESVYMFGETKEKTRQEEKQMEHQRERSGNM